MQRTSIGRKAALYTKLAAVLAVGAWAAFTPLVSVAPGMGAPQGKSARASVPQAPGKAPQLSFSGAQKQASARADSSRALDTAVAMPSGFSGLGLFSGGKKVGMLIAMDTASGARVDFLARKLHEADFTFKKLEETYSLGGRKIAMVVSAAFTSDWEGINGYAAENGTDVGSSWDVKSGTVVIRDGMPEIIGGDAQGGRQAFRSVLEGGASMFQQYLVLHNGCARKNINISTKPRFFVEYALAGKTFFGVANFDSTMRVSEAAGILKAMGVKNAVYLDGGAVSQGYYYNYSGGKMAPRIIGCHDWDEMPPIYTNVLVFYSK
ncbi:MAG: phosphodiester glycosidase family protein [Candidatus Micrarchaeia archaeon]|jgi:hypothetical protein